MSAVAPRTPVQSAEAKGIRKMRFDHIRRLSAAPCGAAVLVLIATLFAAGEAFAVAGFSRQTGMSCNMCHTSHGGATPNFTFSGKKFNALGYRTPRVQVPDVDKGEAEDQGEFMRLLPTNWSGRFQWEALSNVKPPAGPNAGEWGEEETNPTARLAIFPFVGPVGDHFGMWSEFYVLPLRSVNQEWGIADTSYEEVDFRYVVNPDADNVFGFALNNQGVEGLFGFGPWPAVGLESEWANRGGLNGWTHPNFANIFAYGWMNDRWVWALGENTGDTNFGWSESNEVGMLGYAWQNGFSDELWTNLYFRSGNDVIPFVTDTSVPAEEHAFFFSEGIQGIGATRPAPCPSDPTFIEAGCPYLAEDVDDSTSVAADVRWSRHDVGDWSWEIVGRFSHDTEEYVDGAEAEKNMLGIATQFTWRHTYYIKPYVRDHTDFTFNDALGTEYDVDTSPTYGIWLAFKPVENFLLSFEYHNLQAWSLNEQAQDDGARYHISADIAF